MTDNIKTLPISEISRDKLDKFLIETFGEIKGNFLIEHGDWWRHGNWNSPALFDEDADKVVGYTSYTSIRLLLNGQPLDTIWWGDMFVDRDYRGRRLQSRMNAYVKEGGLAFGFPNEMGAKVYARDGWGVIRGIGQKLTLPFTLMADRRIRHNRTIKGKVARLASQIISPIMGAVRRQQFKTLNPQNVQILTSPSAELLSDVFMRYQKDSNLTMSYRDIEHVQWRLIDAPYDKTFYAVGNPDQPDLIMVTRILTLQGLKTLRILDYFGDIENVEVVRPALQMSMKEASEHQVDQIIMISTRPNIIKLCQNLGFSLHEDVSFCWYTNDEGQDKLINDSDWHWTIADYDFDIVE